MKKLLTVLLVFVSGWCVGQNQRIWSTYYGGTSVDDGHFIKTDKYGNVYLTGQTNSQSGIASGGFQNNMALGNAAFLAKFNAAGDRLWATYYGGRCSEEGNGIAIDANGNIYLAGTSCTDTGIAFNGFQNTLDDIGNSDAMLVKFDSSGNRLWATYYGGQGGENGYAVAVDAFDNVYLAGETNSETGIASGGHQNSYGAGNGFCDAFLVKFDSDGNRLWATYYT